MHKVLVKLRSILGAVLPAAVFLVCPVFLNNEAVHASPSGPLKNHPYYQVYALENGVAELIFTGPKLVYDSILHVMTAHGIDGYTLEPARIEDITVIKAYRYRREGKVPFFMFHRMNGNLRDPYGITPANFKSFLEKLKEKNFFPLGHPAIYNADFDGGPSGFHPCNIMVDDLDQGWGQFADMVESHFGRDLQGRIPVTFSVPFIYYGRSVFDNRDDAAQTLRWIHENAYLANHSLEHKPLKSYGPNIDGFISEQIDEWYDEAAAYLGEDAYDVDTFVLPEGIGLANDRFMSRMAEHPYVRHVVGVVDSIADPWNGPVYRYIVNNGFWKQAVDRAARENPYTAGNPENIEECAVFILQGREKIDCKNLPERINAQKLPVYLMVKKE